MHLSAEGPTTWPDAALTIGLLFLAVVTVLYLFQSLLDIRKTKIRADQEEQLRQLVGRYEQLAEKTLDAQQRTAADVAELRTRTASIEQILRTVE
ncbi:hypothetical protein ABZ816_25090 [Actinosynnema sp. NPDC047251]|uniref:Putative membrane protein n=1 Tax=Saccharothrix espanaensis (strain ATCC 51144 / DSM 44229 / JCM 9112 / NBRC 15066 / NRRL 15764) TaxID=1179773 RepID=K0K291_SACES|nr:hypothetical protein [Saccharothrix espanaensis]CCH31682.1 putative membrane protein [Saccharothrix espanaensis DSM 44229]